MLPLRYLFLLCVIFALTWAAPADESESKDVAAAEGSTNSKKKESAEEKTAIVDTFDSLMSPSTQTIVASVLGVFVLLAGVSLVGYHFVYQYYFSGYNNAADPQYSGYYGGAAQPSYQQPAYTYSVGRSLDTTPPTWNFSWGQVMYMLSLAQESYEKFDFQSMDCQKKALCELVQKQTEFGETGRKISNTFSFMDVVQGLPMPSLIQTYMKEYKEALEEGKNSSKECSAIYPECRFSLKEVIAKYRKRAASGKF